MTVGAVNQVNAFAHLALLFAGFAQKKKKQEEKKKLNENALPPLSTCYLIFIF